MARGGWERSGKWRGSLFALRFFFGGGFWARLAMRLPRRAGFGLSFGAVGLSAAQGRPGPRAATLTIDPREVKILHLRPEFESSILPGNVAINSFLMQPEQKRTSLTQSRVRAEVAPPHLETHLR